MNAGDGHVDVFINGCNVSDVRINTCNVSDVCVHACHVFDICIITSEMSLMFV
jgi:hypothetical protein